jgi:hypothetical protein
MFTCNTTELVGPHLRARNNFVSPQHVSKLHVPGCRIKEIIRPQHLTAGRVSVLHTKHVLCRFPTWRTRQSGFVAATFFMRELSRVRVTRTHFCRANRLHGFQPSTLLLNILLHVADVFDASCIRSRGEHAWVLGAWNTSQDISIFF